VRFEVKDTLTEEEVQPGLKTLLKDGLTSQAMVTLTGGVFLVAFALKLGASNLQIGLLAAIPPLTQLTTFEGHLPQGAPTSTCLANLALLPVVEECREMVSTLSLELSQFVDDVGIPGNPSDFDIITDICQIFSRHGFRVGRHKLHLMRSGRAQKVTGLTVNRSLGIPRKGRSRIRAAVHELERSTLCSEALACHCRKVMGRIRHMGAFHSGVAEKLVSRVEEVAKSCG